jgi:predicted RNA binding protein YcfA (HicA-like mRNA interferase family)
MTKFPVDVPIEKILKVFELLGFSIVRKGNHIAMIRDNADGTRTTMTIPNHRMIKGSTLRTILTQVGISRDDFLKIYRNK